MHFALIAAVFLGMGYFTRMFLHPFLACFSVDRLSGPPAQARQGSDPKRPRSARGAKSLASSRYVALECSVAGGNRDGGSDDEDAMDVSSSNSDEGGDEDKDNSDGSYEVDLLGQVCRGGINLSPFSSSDLSVRVWEGR